ncbi:MAG: family 16 glycosylhydrolase [Lachnospira sp.]
MKKIKNVIVVIAGCIAIIVAVISFTPRQETFFCNDSKNYKLIFSDEFNLPNGSQPDSTKWSRCKRNNSLWNRWISDSKDVVFIKDGCLVCRAIPNTTAKNDTVPMLTGAIETRDTYSFMYGKVEVRMKTKKHKGNFPAVWMKNYEYKDPSIPYGEIDIIEVFGDKKETAHTAHTKLTLSDAKYRNSNHSEKSLDPEKWHVYGIEWDENRIKWFVDGKLVHIYIKSSDKKLLKKGQWTFDYPFFLILNQSVGEGAHGMVPDFFHTYETLFDWVRVYQETK